jgi:hypothetical protein
MQAGMRGSVRWLITLGAALLALAACISVAWLVTAWDLATRVAVGTAAAAVFATVITAWGAAGGGRQGTAKQIAGDERPATVTVVMTAARESPPRSGWELSSPARHEGRMLDGRLSIRPAHPYLDLMESGAVLTDLKIRAFSWPWGALPAALDIKMVNNTGATVIAHQVRLDVRRSRDYIRSVPLVGSGGVTLIPDAMYFDSPIKMFTHWRAPGDYVLRFSLEHPSRPGALTSEYAWRFKETVLRGRDHPLMRALVEAGARARMLDETPELSPHNHVWELGPFGESQAVMTGTVEYTETDPDDMEIPRCHQFRALIDLKVGRKRDGLFQASVMPPSERYTAHVLKKRGDDYVIEVPVSHVLAAGEADRLLVTLRAEEFSVHDFDVTLLCDSGEVACGSVRLETFKTNESYERRPDPDRVTT